MIKISTQRKKVPAIIRQVRPLGFHHLELREQQAYDDLKAQLDTLLLQPSPTCVQEILRYGEFVEENN